MNKILGIAQEKLEAGDIIMIDELGHIRKATTKKSSKKGDCIKTHGIIVVKNVKSRL